MSFDPHKLTWAALLGQWVEFARSAVALPDDAQGRAWKASVPDIIGLQAVACALGELDRLSPQERALGLDRARVLIERHTQNLRERFGAELHPGLEAIVGDARAALARAEPPGPEARPTPD